MNIQFLKNRNISINTQNTILENIDLKDGILEYYDFDIDFNLSFMDQKWSFKQDLIQIAYDNNDKYVIDVGWYKEFDPNGKFTIVVIKDYDWTKPIFKKKCKDLQNLKKNIQKAVEKIYFDENS